MTRIGRKIFSTLLYHSIFDYPLTIDEIHHYLISEKIVPLSTLKEEIGVLLKVGKILSGGEFFISSSIIHYPLSIIVLRRHRKDISQKKLMIAKRASRVISIIPWVKMIAITGALAMENVDEKDDIDLMIITSKNRLWIVRPLVLLFVSLFFKRRHPLSNATTNHQSGGAGSRSAGQLITHNNEICVNLWLDESALVIPEGQRNLYTAHELAQMKPIVNKEKTYEKMLIRNKWGEKFLANFWSTIQQFNNLTINNQQFATNNPLNLLNLFLFCLQFTYMKAKMTNERVSLHAAFFHPGNRADTILTAYDRLRHRDF
ncbi:hypothetical protein HYU89_01635 [Candidatus Collierbacteria bacterium]|nr:hypothetical protein [Candidatus Collierbacteria bacterium]